MSARYLDTTNQKYPSRGDRVLVIQKKDYASGELTKGVVKDVLTKKRRHPRGHKVRLTSGVIGRVQQFVGEKEPQDASVPTPPEPFDEEYDLR